MKKILPFAFASSILLVACSSPGSSPESSSEPIKSTIKEENVSYSLGDSINMDGFMAYDEAVQGKRPVVLIVHEWWGLNDYVKSRTKQLAEMGYLTMAVDLYGDGLTVEYLDGAQKISKSFFANPGMAKARFDAAIAKIKEHPQADTSQIAAIGYGLGGGMVLNFARMGENLRGVVSFHGRLLGMPAVRDLLKADILVCHGEDDKMVSAPEVAEFKKQLDEINAAYTVRTYPGATHAFSNPAATENGEKFDLPIAYNAEADTASFKEMESFLVKIFKM